MSLNIEIKDLENLTLYDNKTIITTLTNYGYILYTLNMLKSLKPFGLDKKVFIFLNSLGSPTFDGLWLVITKQAYWTPFFLLLAYLLYKIFHD
jgi:hypothetical protein